MALKDSLFGQGKRLATSAVVVRVLSDDRVMRVVNGVMDSRNRVRAAAEKAGEAWSLLLHGHELPTIDPALDESIPTKAANGRVNGAAVNGHAPAPVARANGAVAKAEPAETEAHKDSQEKD